MTRRVRFTPLSCTRAFAVAGLAAAALLGPSPAHAAAIPFAPASPISTLATRPEAVSPTDVDRDGDLDVVVGWADGLPRVGWMENTAGNGSAWTLRTIATGTTDLLDLETADLDGDGDSDVVVTLRQAGAVVWYENTSNGAAWTPHTLSTAVALASKVAVGDVDRDGDVDVVAASSGTGPDVVVLLENAAGNGTSWTPRTVYANARFTRAVEVADIDGDGDADVLVDSGNDQTISWHENLLGNGTLWLARTVTTTGGGAEATTADVDRDGDLDVIARVSNSSPGWYENVAGNGQGWVAHTIATPSGLQGTIVARDLDGDGDVDAVTAATGASAVQWFENVSGNGSAWVTRTIATNAAPPTVAAVGDLDGDGDPDVVFVAEFANEVSWYRNDSTRQTACFGPVRTIFAVDTPFGLSTADIDHDGDPDAFLVSRGPQSAVHWLRNDGGGAAWTPVTIATNGAFVFSMSAADVDGDGDPDGLLGGDLSIPPSFVENVSDGQAWFVQSMATPGGPVAVELKSADVDGDGDLDAVGSEGPSALNWFENQNGLGDTWATHTVATAAINTNHPSFPTDLDGDGDVDIVLADFTSALVWYENVSGNGTSWTRRTVSGAGAFTVVPIDLDGDQDLDLLASNPLSLSLVWHENLGGAGAWSTHSLGSLDVTTLEPRDLDGDGDVDFVAWLGSNAGWLERTAPGVAFTPHTVAAGVPGEVTSADVDGDGSVDILSTAQLADVVRWNRNGRGHVLVDLSDQVPGMVENNDVFPIFRLTVTHAGRAGDANLELARIGLLLEEDLGDPLSTAEANALIAELRVYRDTNGNGTFDPGTDTLITTVPNLALTAGVQTIALPDGDPNLQVAFGTPQTYFVVAQLTGTASQQAPNQFRVTHLAIGPSATQAEHAPSDTPLAVACPADFASRVIGPVTPVELMGFTVE